MNDYKSKYNFSLERIAIKDERIKFFEGQETINANYDRLADQVIKHLKKDGKLDEPYMAYAHLKRTFTKNELIKEVTDRTEVGTKLIDGMVTLAFDLLSRSVENTKDFKAHKPKKNE